MNFGDFYGNDGLKRRLASAAGQNKLPHSFLISGPEGSGKHTLAALLSAVFQCTGSGEKPCRRCSACRKVFSGQHPDVIVVDDPTKKIVPVGLIREACADLSVRPNEGSRKIYIIPRAQDMNDAAQNALLKVMEEPPAYGVFLLLTDNPNRQLPTIRSRCAELSLSPLPQEMLDSILRTRFPEAGAEERQAACFRSGGYLGQALQVMQGASALLPQTEQFAKAYAERSDLALAEVLVPMEKLKREQLLPILSQWLSVLEAALSARAGLPAESPLCAAICRSRTNAELLRAIQTLQRAQEQAAANVGCGHICGALTVLLR